MNAVELILELGRWGQKHPTELIVGTVAAPLVLGTASLVLRKGRSASTTHGSARWATPREAKRAGLFGDEGVVLGRLGGRLLCENGETHVLLVGPTRSKKGVGVIIPTLLNWVESVISLDPKDGENYDVTARWRSRVPAIGLPTLRRVGRRMPASMSKTRFASRRPRNLGMPTPFPRVSPPPKRW